MRKTCKACGESKTLGDFYKQPVMADGHMSRCKECHKMAVRKNYAAKRDRYAAYERERFSRPERKKNARKYLQKHRERHPDRYRARQAVGVALRSGRLTKEPCRSCGGTVRVEAHHHDYSKPLDVEWVCFKCHREERHSQKTTPV